MDQRNATTSQSAEAEAMPTELRVAAARDRLGIVWSDGRRDDFDAGKLRHNCQSAGAKRLRLDNRAVPPAGGLTIAEIKPVGSYAINIVFSDGHARGIYPWSLLRALA